MELVIYEKKGAISYLTLNRPAVMNVINSQTIDEITDALGDFASDPASRVLIMSGNGEKAFSAGVDLKEASTSGGGKWAKKKKLRNGRTMFEMLIETWKPIICAINGLAVGAGCELALASDIRIAREGAMIGLPEAKVGMGASFGSLMLPRIIPIGHALQMLFTGKLVSAERALEIGLVNEVVPADRLIKRCEEIAEEIAQCAPLSVRKMKESAWKGREIPLFHATRMEFGPNVYESEDCLEGALAFLEKRKPNWKNR